MPGDDHRQIIQLLNENLLKYHQQFSEQFHLQIPKGAIKKVDFYRDTFFAYLKDSVYKSNICYLLQTIDFQIWLYKLFKPKLSVENTYFYQLTVSMGIVSEALACAMLLDVAIETDAQDRSLGNVSEKNRHIRETITQNTFVQNLRLLKKLQVLSDELLNEYQEIRLYIRNQVHIQGWNGRLYQSLTLPHFQNKLNQFRHFLQKIPAIVNLPGDLATLETSLFGFAVDLEKNYQGIIKSYFSKGGYGFIKLDDSPVQLYFHVSALAETLSADERNLEKLRVQCTLKMGRKGLEACRIEEINEKPSQNHS